LHRWIGGNEFFESSQVSAVVFETTDVNRKSTVDHTSVSQTLKLCKNAGAVFCDRQTCLPLHFGVANELARSLSNVCPPAQKIVAQFRDIYVARIRIEVE
jgi:hypothetical protein